MTRFEQIASAFPLHAQRIAEATREQGNPEHFEWFMTDPCFEGHGAGRLLRGAFIWDRTVEGHNYWNALYRGSL